MKKILVFLLLIIPLFTQATMPYGTDRGLWDSMGYMMQGWGLFGLFYLLAYLVWIIVGILLIVWLWQKINRK